MRFKIALLLAMVFAIYGLSQSSAITHEARPYWTCPMHRQVHKEKEGRCPICGMTLVKIKPEREQQESDASNNAMPENHTPIKLSMNREQMIGVKYGTVERKPLFKTIRAAGRVAFDPELYTAQNEYQEAVRQMERVKNSTLAEVRHSAQTMLQSSKLRLKVMGLSDQQIAALAQGTPRSDQSLLIHQAGEDVYIYAEIYEMDLPDVQPGLEVELSASFLGGKPLTGKVVSVDRVLNANSRTAKARILVPKARTLLRPESFVNVSIHAPLGDQVTIPFDALLETGTQDWIFVKKENGTLEPRLITIKYRAGDQVAIESGVVPGERIVTSANFLVDSESRLKSEMIGCPLGQHWDTSMSMCMPGGD